MDKIYKLDNIDIGILEILMKNAKIPYTEIAKKLIVSTGTIHVRMKKMENYGIVKKIKLEINHEKIGYDLTSFIGIYLEKGSNYNYVINELNKIKEVVEAHYTTGIYSIFAKIICKNTKHMREILNDKIQQITSIQRTETIISLEQSIDKRISL